MKKGLISALAIFSLFMLSACSSEEKSNVLQQSQNQQSLDGEYVEVSKTKDKIKIYSDVEFEIEGDVFTEDDGDMYSIDLEKHQVLDNDSGGVKPYKINEKYNGLFIYEGRNYVRLGSDAYNQLVEGGATIEE